MQPSPSSSRSPRPGTGSGTMQPTGMGYVGLPIFFTSGQFRGRTIRAELVEIQKADLGRKYAKVDRRPLDPPPVVALHLYEVINDENNGQTEQEISNVEEIQTNGLLCTVDLFPVVGLDPPHTSVPQVSSHSPHSSQSSQSSHSNSSSPTSYHHFFGDIPYSLPSGHHLYRYNQGTLAAFNNPQPQPQPQSQSQSRTQSQAQYSSAHTTTMSSTSNPSPHGLYTTLQFSPPPAQPTTPHPSDIVHHVESIPITESSKMTSSLVGSTFVMPTTIDYQGKKTLLFVFSDLAVKSEGHFILRYRMFDLFSRAWDMQDQLMQAECYGGMFRVYSTKEFPGLQASTELTKNLSRYGVRLNIRETERRRKKSEPTTGTDDYIPSSTSGSTSVSEGVGSKRKHLSDGDIDAYGDY